MLVSVVVGGGVVVFLGVGDRVLVGVEVGNFFVVVVGIVVCVLFGIGCMSFDVIKGESVFIVGWVVYEWKIDGDCYELKSLIEMVGIVVLFVDVWLG